MSHNQKRAWGNIIVWGTYLLAMAILFINKGTIFFWHEDSFRYGFYLITGIAIIAWFITMAVIWKVQSKTRVSSDERDIEIMSKVNSAAGPIAMTAVAVTSLILAVIYVEDKNSVMSPYFLFYLTMINVVVYWLAQAINTLVGYGKN